VVVERFRDEVDDWQVCVLTPYGGRVHAPWSLALCGGRYSAGVGADGARAGGGPRERATKVRAGTVPLRGAVKEVERRELAPVIKAQVERDRAELKALAEEINPPDFDPVENADQVRQRGEFTRLCTDLAKLPPPAQFMARHDGKLRPTHVEPERAALAWLTEFVAAWEARS
jgi:hypothetical protein